LDDSAGAATLTAGVTGPWGGASMTEAEWLACEDSLRMLRSPVGKASNRKSRLLACAFCRRVWSFIKDDRSRRAVEAAEAFSDGHGKLKEAREEARVALGEAATDVGSPTVYATSCAAQAIGHSPAKAAYEGAYMARLAVGAHEASSVGWANESQSQANILRDILGNPFRPPALVPTCQTASVLSLARVAYDERHIPSGHLDNARLAVLSDALEEAGCTDADLLGHLRSPGPHVRGCWALDLILGKE
jgi:hypothetical protein